MQFISFFLYAYFYFWLFFIDWEFRWLVATHTRPERERERWKGAVMMCTPPVATLPTNNGKWTLTC
jgi:hypothetical protein